jgi:hypothetical protein
MKKLTIIKNYHNKIKNKRKKIRNININDIDWSSYEYLDNNIKEAYEEEENWLNRKEYKVSMIDHNRDEKEIFNDFRFVTYKYKDYWRVVVLDKIAYKSRSWSAYYQTEKAALKGVLRQYAEYLKEYNKNKK